MKKTDKRGVVGIFLFFVLLRLFFLFFYEKSFMKFADVMSVFVCYACVRMSLSDFSALFVSWLAGLFEDIASGTVLGVNAASKLSMAFSMRFLSRKIEIGNFAVQLVFVIFFFAFDVIFKYALVTVIMHISLAEEFLWSILLVKVCVNTILFVIICAVLR